MKTLVLAIAAVLLVGAVPAMAQVRVEVQVPLPVIRFEAAPPLVVVESGVRVVEDYDEEVFFVDRAYWVCREGRWFRARDYRGGWVAVERYSVPRSVRALPPGRYRRFRAPPGHERHHHHDRYERRGGHDRMDHYERRGGGDRHGRHDGSDRRGGPDRRESHGGKHGHNKR